MSEARISKWRWIVGTLTILVAWILIGSLLTGLVAKWWELDLRAITSTDEKSIAIVRSYQPWRAATAVLLSFIPLFVTTCLAYRYILKKPLLRLFTMHDSLNPKRIAQGAFVMALILIITAIPDFIINSKDYTWSFKSGTFLPYLLMALILIPLQTSSEELFYRGWLQQWSDNGRRSIVTISLFNGLLFALPHLSNPEVKGELFLAVIGYGSTGFMFAWTTYRDRSLELALGAHAANNLIAGLLVSSSDSALPAASLWTTPPVAWGPAAIVSLITIPLFIAGTRRFAR